VESIIGDLDPSTRPSASLRMTGGVDSRFRGNDKGNGKDSGFKPYYVAHTKIQTLALLDEKHKGSNWYQWRRR